MKKTYVTNLPNHIGAFLQASKCFASLGINITRVSYNKAVDSHTLFIDACGSEEQLKKADEQLAKIGYLQKDEPESSIILIEFKVKDEPGGVTEILELIESFSFNISYMSSQESNTEYQLFKMGLFVEEESVVSEFLNKAEAICEFRVIDYNRSEKIFDNSIFYNSFVSSLIRGAGISGEERENLLINTNLAMQMLDEHGRSPYQIFDSISKFADMLASNRGEAFMPRITKHKISENTNITLIEPPCGSNVIIIKSFDKYLFVDSGYAYYKEEMTAIFRELIEDFDTIEKNVLITHADVDHCGLLPMFDKIIASEKSAQCLRAEFNGEESFREKNPLHKPYVRICKALTSYCPPNPEKIEAAWRSTEAAGGVLRQCGFFSFGDLEFEVYEGAGGHLPGEIVLIDYAHRIAFTGDIYVNIGGMTERQRQYNKYAPILLNSVDTDRELCAAEREAIMQRLGAGKWQIFGAHGHKKEYEVVRN